MQTGFIFGQGTDISDPKELARRRAIVDAMMAQQAQQGANMEAVNKAYGMLRNAA